MVSLLCIMNRIVFPIEDTSQRETCNGIQNEHQENLKTHEALKENSYFGFL